MSDKWLTIKPIFKFSSSAISILRYVLGSTLAIGLAMGFAWKLSFLLPVLALGYFAPKATYPTLKEGLFFIGTIITSSFISLFFTKFLLEYRLVFIPLLGLAILHVFYTNKFPAQEKVFILLSLLLIPMLAFQSIAIAYVVTNSIIINAGVTLMLVWIMYAIIPKNNNSSKPTTTATPINQKERYTKALETLLIVFPVLLSFFFFQWTGGLLILIFIVLLSMQPSFTLKAGVMMILGNLIGGIVAIIAYELLVIVPKFTFLILVILLAGLLFARQLFSDKPIAPLFGMAFSTVLLILGQATSGDDDAGDKVWIRVIQIMIAVLYVVIIFNIVAALKERRKNKKLLKINKL